LYDTANDPHQIRNLAASSDKAKRLTTMRKLLRDWQDRTRDLGFLPECDLAERMGSSVPYDMARRDDVYPLAKIRAAAEWVGAGPDAMDEQVKLLRDADPAVRYWAAIGLHVLGKDAAGATDALTAAMKDKAPAVRIEAAWALADLGKGKEALAVLVKDLEGANSRARVRAARALQMLGRKARPVLPAMQRAFKASQRAKGNDATYIRFALDPAVKALSK